MDMLVSCCPPHLTRSLQDLEQFAGKKTDMDMRHWELALLRYQNHSERGPPPDVEPFITECDSIWSIPIMLPSAQHHNSCSRLNCITMHPTNPCGAPISFTHSSGATQKLGSQCCAETKAGPVRSPKALIRMALVSARAKRLQPFLIVLVLAEVKDGGDEVKESGSYVCTDISSFATRIG